jgi:dipeptidyl aminopeptidase/acylaminoacyl peptidase
MTQSKMFKAAIIADGYEGASLYWTFGNNLRRIVARRQYGGSPYDSSIEALRNYRRFAPSFRARKFAGPVLLLSSEQGTVIDNLELVRFLADADVPVEAVYFPGEGHVFWDPRHRAAVMQRCLDWFNYWLLNKKDINPDKERQYRRWDDQAKSRK